MIRCLCDDRHRENVYIEKDLTRINGYQTSPVYDASPAANKLTRKRDVFRDPNIHEFQPLLCEKPRAIKKRFVQRVPFVERPFIMSSFTSTRLGGVLRGGVEALR